MFAGGDVGFLGAAERCMGSDGFGREEGEGEYINPGFLPVVSRKKEGGFLAFVFLQNFSREFGQYTNTQNRKTN